jgi:hypothetical protein
MCQKRERNLSFLFVWYNFRHMPKYYINKHAYAPKQTYLDLMDRYKEYGKGSREFICHIINCSMSAHLETSRDDFLWEGVYIPVPSAAIVKYFGREVKVTELEDIVIKALTEEGNTYSRVRHLCRAYKLSPNFCDFYFNSYESNYHSLEWVNIFTGKPKRVATNSKETLSLKGVKPSSLVSKAVTQIQKTIYNRPQVEAHMEEMKINSSRSDKDRFRYISELHTYSFIKNNSININETISEYTPRFITQMSGRVSEVGGGFQSCSRAMKHAAFSNISNVYNYDLKSSQILGLLQMFEEAGVDTNSLLKILEINKKEIAATLGLTVEGFKATQISVILGALLLPFLNAGKNKHSNAVFDGIAATALEDLEAVYTKVYDWFTPLKKDINKWHSILVEVALATMNRQKYITNVCGVKFNLRDYIGKSGKLSKSAELRRKLAAFYLQGQEACFIHHLTILSKKYGFTVISNQHDGLVTVGEIPAEAIKEASKLSGLKYAELEKKNFVEGKEFHNPTIKEVEKTEAEVRAVPQLKSDNFHTTVKAKPERKRRRGKALDNLLTQWIHEDIDLVALMEQAELEDRRKMLSG